MICYILKWVLCNAIIALPLRYMNDEYKTTAVRGIKYDIRIVLSFLLKADFYK